MVLTSMAKLFYALVEYYTNENSEYDAFNFESIEVVRDNIVKQAGPKYFN